MHSLGTHVILLALSWNTPAKLLPRPAPHGGAPVPVAVQVAQRHAQHARVQRGRAQRLARRRLKVERLVPQRVRQEVGAAQRQAALEDPAARAAALRLVGPGRAGTALSSEAGEVSAWRAHGAREQARQCCIAARALRACPHASVSRAPAAWQRAAPQENKQRRS